MGPSPTVERFSSLPEQTLVIRGGAVGDFVLTLPLLHAVRRRCPTARVDILGYPAIAELAVRSGFARRIGDIGAPEWAGLFAREGGLARRAADLLRPYDRAVCVWPDGEGVIEANLRAACEGDVHMVNPMPPEGGGVHAVDFVNEQLRAAGFEDTEATPRLDVSAEDAAWAEAWWGGGSAGRPGMVIHAGSGGRNKNWPAEGFAELARRWAAETGGGVTLTEGPADEECVAELETRLKGLPFRTLPRERLSRVAAVLARCDAYVGNDSGISHLAAAVGAPTVALFGPTDPRAWAPRGPQVAVIQRDRMSPEAVVAGALAALRRLQAQSR